jgi:hypothetical protein
VAFFYHDKIHDTHTTSESNESGRLLAGNKKEKLATLFILMNDSGKHKIVA